MILEGHDQLDEGPKADIYALGCLAFYLTKSDSDWSNENLNEDEHSMLGIITQQGHLRRLMRQEPEVEEFISKCLASVADNLQIEQVLRLSLF